MDRYSQSRPASGSKRSANTQSLSPVKPKPGVRRRTSVYAESNLEKAGMQLISDNSNETSTVVGRPTSIGSIGGQSHVEKVGIHVNSDRASVRLNESTRMPLSDISNTSHGWPLSKKYSGIGLALDENRNNYCLGRTSSQNHQNLSPYDSSSANANPERVSLRGHSLFGDENKDSNRSASRMSNVRMSGDKEKYCSPGARTLASIDLDGITPHRPNTHTPKTTESTTTKLGSFHLPTSSITKQNRGDFQTPNSTVGTTTKLGSFHLPTSCITKEKVIVANSHKRTVDESLDDLTDNARRNLIQTLEDAADHEDGSDYDAGEVETLHFEYDLESDDVNEDVDLNLDSWADYQDLGPPDKVCQHCNSLMWNAERNNKSNKNAAPTFSICCRNGQVELPPEREPPAFLSELLAGGPRTKHYKISVI